VAPDGGVAATRDAVLADVEVRMSTGAPTIRPLTLNTRYLLHQPSAELAAKLDARVEAGFTLDGDDYPSSRSWSRVVVPAIAVGTLDLALLVGSATAAAFHLHLAWLVALLSLIVFVACGVVAGITSAKALRDPLRLTTNERRELNQAHAWQSTQPWVGRPSSTPEYHLLCVAHETVARLANSRTWASRYLDDHRLRLNLVQELSAIDVQACQLAHLRIQIPAGQRGRISSLDGAWNALVDRVTRLKNYASGVDELDEHVAALADAAQVASLDSQFGELAAGTAMDEFAAAQVAALSADLHRLAVTSFATSRESGT
jgi:hypothetical protein